MRIAIIGGGISGLSLAYFLEQKRGDNATTIDIYERSDRLGGKIQTAARSDCSIELGPDALLHKSNSPAAKLISELELDSHLITPQQRTFAIQRNGKLHSIPVGMLTKYPGNLIHLWQCRLLSVTGKISASITPLLSRFRKKERGRDISLTEALRPRYGKEISSFVYETVFGGVHSGKADELSFRALYPHLADPQKNKQPGKAHFISFEKGMQQLPDTLVKKLQYTTFHKNTDVTAIEQNGTKYIVVSDKKEVAYDYVCLAVPADRAAELTSTIDTSLSQALSQIRHASSAVVTVAIQKDKVGKPPKGTGYLLPESEQGIITGCTYSSLKWPDRSKKDTFLMRFFFGRKIKPKELTDLDLIAATKKELKEKLDFEGEPLFFEITRWNSGLPQYEIGHLEKLKHIKEQLARFPGLSITGTSYQGVGIPDCIRQAEELSSQLVEEIQKRGNEHYEHTACA